MGTVGAMSGVVEGAWLCREGSEPRWEAQGGQVVLVGVVWELESSSEFLIIRLFQRRTERWGHEVPGLEYVR